jgi:hypothetical protein
MWKSLLGLLALLSLTMAVPNTEAQVETAQPYWDVYPYYPRRYRRRFYYPRPYDYPRRYDYPGRFPYGYPGRRFPGGRGF